jgi:hypothetical protein
VADEDLLIGIGAIAWLFDIKKSSINSTTLPAMSPTKVEHTIGVNEKSVISEEEPSMEEKILAKFTYPGTEPANSAPLKKSKPAEPTYQPLEWGDITKKPEDPTLDFSILLIAKPIPFKFDLKPRDTVRMDTVRELFEEGVANGDYPETREYWGPNQGRSMPLGWSKV